MNDFRITFKPCNTLCLISDLNRKLGFKKKLGIFEISLKSRFQIYKNFWNPTMDFYFLPLWQCFTNFWLLFEEIMLTLNYFHQLTLSIAKRAHCCWANCLSLSLSDRDSAYLLSCEVFHVCKLRKLSLQSTLVILFLD